MFINFNHTIRTDQNDMSGKYHVTQSELSNLFSSITWEEKETRNGHRKLINRVTKVVIEYVKHGNNGGVDPGAAQNICEKLQEHLDILHDEIFALKNKGWKHAAINYDLVAQRWFTQPKL